MQFERFLLLAFWLPLLSALTVGKHKQTNSSRDNWSSLLFEIIINVPICGFSGPAKELELLFFLRKAHLQFPLLPRFTKYCTTKLHIIFLSVCVSVTDLAGGLFYTQREEDNCAKAPFYPEGRREGGREE